jgi:hypothetical protein
MGGSNNGIGSKPFKTRKKRGELSLNRTGWKRAGRQEIWDK